MSLTKFISIIFHPIFIPILVFSIVFYVLPQTVSYHSEALFFLWFILLLGTVFLPIFSILYLIKKNKIDSLEIMDHKQRKFILFPIFLFFILSFIAIHCLFPNLYDVKNMYIGACIISLLCFFISIKWKISLHAAGSGSALGSLFGLHLIYGELMFWLAIFFLISILVGYSRIKERAHTFNQVLFGFLLGFIIESCSVIYL